MTMLQVFVHWWGDEVNVPLAGLVRIPIRCSAASFQQYLTDASSLDVLVGALDGKAQVCLPGWTWMAHVPSQAFRPHATEVGRAAH